MQNRIPLVLGCCILLTACAPVLRSPVPPSAMTIESPAFLNGEPIPKKYACDGGKISPPLVFSGVPSGAQHLALIVSDSDAPGGDFVHWVVYGIHPTASVTPEGTTPGGGLLGKAGTGKEAYVPPCPPSGTHRYFFRLYALDAAIDFEATPTKAALLDAMRGHVLAEAELKGLYKK